MEIPVLLFAVALLCVKTEGDSNLTPLFVQTGKDLFLQVKKAVTLQSDSDFTWRMNNSINIVKFDITKKKIYDDRAEFSGQNYSLLLKNVQKNDSGDYTAHVSGKNVQRVAAYKVTVQDPVSPVKLTLNSSSTCNFNVTCSTVDSRFSSTFRCDNQTCSQEGGDRSEATTNPVPISVYLEHGFIVCNHSNHVSWTQAKQEIKTICEPRPVENGAVPAAIGASGIVVVMAALCIILFKKYKQKNNGKKVLKVPQESNQAQTLNVNPTEDASSASPTSTYCTVQFHKRPQESTTTDPPHPETIYAQVNRSTKTKCRSPPPKPTPRDDKD